MSGGASDKKGGYLEDEGSFEGLYTFLQQTYTLPMAVDIEGFHSSYALCNQVFRRIFPRTHGLDFCEIGCAPGFWPIYFYLYFYYNVYGIDLSANGIRLTRQNLDSMNIPGEMIFGDIFDLPFGENRFDVVFSHSFMEHFEDPMPVFEIHHRMAKPGGYIYVGIPNMRYFNNLTRMLVGRFAGKWNDLHKVMNFSTADTEVFQKAAKAFGWDILWLDYVGFYVPLLDIEPKPGTPGQGGRRLGRFVGRDMPSSRLFSPTLCMVAQKR